MAVKKRNKNLALRILLLISAGCVLFFVLLIGMLCIREGMVPRNMDNVQEPYDAVIVLGAQVKPDGSPSVQLTWRLDSAVLAWQKKNVPIVVCGAQGKDEPEPEAETMKNYLVSKGIPEGSVLKDPDSYNTEQNLKHAKSLLDDYPEQISKVLVVTSDYHVPRSLALAHDIGLDAEGLGSPCLPEYWFKNHGREALAWCKYWLKKYLHISL